MRNTVHWVHRLLLVLLFLAVPTLLVTSNVGWAFRFPLLSEYGFSRHHISEATGIAPGDLRRIARDLAAYFSSPEEFLDIRVAVSGVERPLLNQRELIHMRDVKGLVQGILWAQVISLALLGAYIIAGFTLGRGRFPLILGQRLRAAALVTAGGVLVVGVILVVAFPALFRLFHVVSFRNQFWLLDPKTDYLMRLFPNSFFFEATLFIALATLVEATMLALLAWGWLRIASSRGASSHSQDQGPE